MALVTPSASADVEAVSGASANRIPNLPDLVAGEALLACAPVYIKSSDGKLWMSNATAANEAAEVIGMTGKTYVAGEPVTLFPPGTVFYYSDDFSGASIDPGAVLYLGATAGRLDTAATTGDQHGIAVVLDDNHIVFTSRRTGAEPDVSQAALNAMVQGVAADYKIARGETALDGSNPTPVAHGLTTCIAFTATLKGTAAPGVGTSVLTANISGANVNVYAWKVTGAGDTTLIASTGTESFYWIAVGT
jgi:hypothetical protein